jgi:hypothetical protein
VTPGARKYTYLNLKTGLGLGWEEGARVLRVLFNLKENPTDIVRTDQERMGVFIIYSNYAPFHRHSIEFGLIIISQGYS